MLDQSDPLSEAEAKRVGEAFKAAGGRDNAAENAKRAKAKKGKKGKAKKKSKR